VLECIAAWRGYLAKIRKDIGLEFISVTLADGVETHGIQLEFIEPGKPTQISYVERFNRTYRTEVLKMYAFRRLSEVREITDSWVREYNEEKPHDSLGYLTTREYLTANSNKENYKSQWT
jgi:putative transposase